MQNFSWCLYCSQTAVIAWTAYAIYEILSVRLSQSIFQLVSQWASQLVSQSLPPYIRYLVSHRAGRWVVSQSVCLSVCLSASEPASQPASQPASRQSVSRSVDHRSVSSQSIQSTNERLILIPLLCLAVQTDIRLHCKEWDLLLEERNWQPQQILAKLPRFLQFLRQVQRSVIPLVPASDDSMQTELLKQDIANEQTLRQEKTEGNWWRVKWPSGVLGRVVVPSHLLSSFGLTPKRRACSQAKQDSEFLPTVGKPKWSHSTNHNKRKSQWTNNYSRLLTTWTFRGNRKRFELTGAENKWLEARGKTVPMCISIHRVYIMCVVSVIFLDYILYNQKVTWNKTKQSSRKRPGNANNVGLLIETP